ncbi:N-acetylglucosamine kinase [Anditalea andensis]|uniref:N-acetylglucosamine kinase n=1 Tax=Anditalea andensis TaxID=1048983 RepID=A0A074KSH6_9BACT|nr:N-acetylglucosamine kinase [Anditalea andensis]KEO72916.1 N-acetylglucosamine kinase [Anditalea andensis]
MILIADSGSSKTDWRYIDEDGNIGQIKTVGFNPYYQGLEEMIKALQLKDLFAISDKVSGIFYYGAGCSNPKNREIVKNALLSIFPSADIHVDHDLLAAARATCGKNMGIACILGTGSNSCDYDGEYIIATRPSPGYILGDEGGGAYIGRQFLHDYIYDEMPYHIKEKVTKEYNLSALEIQENVYQKPFPGRYMATFCHFLYANKKDPYCYGLFHKAFHDFFAKHVMHYDDFQSKPVSFVGSIAYHNSDILRKTALELGIHIHMTISSPIAGLTLYHKEMMQ